MYSNRGKGITFLIVPILTIFIKHYLFQHLGLITSQITLADATFTVTSVIYLIVGLIFVAMARLPAAGAFSKVVCVLYIALFVYLCAADMNIISWIPKSYISFLIDEMPLYSLWTAMAAGCLIRH